MTARPTSQIPISSAEARGPQLLAGASSRMVLPAMYEYRDVYYLPSGSDGVLTEKLWRYTFQPEDALLLSHLAAAPGGVLDEDLQPITTMDCDEAADDPASTGDPVSEALKILRCARGTGLGLEYHLDDAIERLEGMASRPRSEESGSSDSSPTP